MAEEKTVSKNVAKLVEEVSALTVLELSELVTELQEKLGVSAMPMAAAPVAAAAAPEAAAADSGSSTQTVVLTNAGAQKIAVIKALREINPNLGLKEAKDMTEAVPAEVLKDAKAEDAKVAAEKLKAAGATVEMK
ncbi:50S ribosomal protein L7/L12 [Candidatus Woesebacteria bacterium]|jgi:large subunit ribosomal protein L7/L12|nr:50S ribosomal protein L7/L12 [Candidatus Woesebacteria bacterium]MBP9687453.1 50S ribosomal protein L7/L12 [Candidatus Woesebacteria bacterium]